MQTYTTNFRKNQDVSKYEMERRWRNKNDEEPIELLYFSFKNYIKIEFIWDNFELKKSSNMI